MTASRSRAQSVRRVLVLVVAGVIAGGVSCAREPATAPPARDWNLLLVVIDTLRADHVGAYGHVRDATPHLDELAERSLTIETAYAQSPWTKPSVASLLTSRRPSHHGVLEEGPEHGLGEAAETLAEVLGRAGWQTAALSQNPHVHPNTGFAQGFDHFETQPGFEGDPRWVTERAAKWFAQRRSEVPFFLYLHWIDPHDPFRPLEAEAKEYAGDLAPSRDDIRRGRLGQIVMGEQVTYSLTDDDVAYLEALYDAELHRVDRALGSLLRDLAARGLTDSTVVVVTSDHGEEFLDHGTLRHGYHLYEESLRVPMIVHVPGEEPRRAREGWAQHVDVAPSLLELVGVPAPDSFQGASFAAAVRGAPLGAAPVVTETSWRGIARCAIREGTHKLIADLQSGARELYDLARDPQERNDLSGEDPTRVASLASSLEALVRGPALPTAERIPAEPDPEQEQALRALGYLEGPESDALPTPR